MYDLCIILSVVDLPHVGISINKQKDKKLNGHHNCLPSHEKHNKKAKAQGCVNLISKGR